MHKKQIRRNKTKALRLAQISAMRLRKITEYEKK